MKALSVRGGWTGRRSRAPTGDFTVAFGHGHPLVLLKPLAIFLLRLEFSLRPSWVCVISLVPVHCDLAYPSCWYTEWERNDHDSNSCKFENWQEALAHLQHILHIHACKHNTSICTSWLNLGQSFDLCLFIAQQCIQTSIKSTKQGQVLASPCDRINASL